MHALSNSDFLALWERGRRLHPMDQGLLAIAAAFPESLQASPADWPLGRRNLALLELHRACFGPGLRGWASCAQCGEKLEFELDSQLPLVRKATCGMATEETIEIDQQLFRLPSSRDLAKLVTECDSHKAAARLLESCWRGNGEVPAWSDEEIEAAGEKFSAADPMAETRMTFQCPECGERCDETLDPPSFVWSEIEARAKRLLAEVHTLASAYGWTEEEIIALSDPRRSLYLEMVRG